MLIKYLNDLDRAVQKARVQPGIEQYARCADCVEILESYLDGQLEPLKRRGLEIMDQLLPVEFDGWLAEVATVRQVHVHSQLAGSA